MGRGGLWTLSIPLAFAGLVAAGAHATSTARVPTRLLRVTYDEWHSDCLCPEDCHDRDTFYVQAQTGTDLTPRRLRYSWAGRGITIRATNVDSLGRVTLEAGNGLVVEQGTSWSPRTQTANLDIGPIPFGTSSFDAGMGVLVEGIDSLPAGAVLGIPSGPKPPPKPSLWRSILNHRPGPIPLPARYAQAAEPVLVRVQLAADGSLRAATIAQTRGALLDAFALKAVRSWAFQVGRDCNGAELREGVVSVAFQPRKP